MEIDMKAIDAVYFQEFINIYKTSQKEQANRGLGLQYFGPKEMQMLIDKIPIIEAEPVRHGRLVEDCCYNTCSLCGNYFDRYDDGGYYQDFDYCPKCGAKMDLKE